MKRAAHVTITLGRSQQAAWLIALLTLVTGAMLWTLWFFAAWPWWGVLLADLMLLGWACVGWRYYVRRDLHHSIVKLTLDAERHVRVYFHGEPPDAAGHAGHVLDSSYVGDFFVTLVWQKTAAWRTRTLLIFPDMLDAESWRRLRVLLRHGRERQKKEPSPLSSQSK